MKLEVLRFSSGKDSTSGALFSVVENEEVNHNIYIPPKLVKDIQVLDETFLI